MPQFDSTQGGIFMKNKNHTLSSLKHQMFEEKHRGKKEKVQKLHPEEVDYLSHFFLVTPYLYEIRVAFAPGFVPGKATAGIIKSLYYDNRKNRKSVVYRTLNSKQVKACRDFGLVLKPYKYKIIL